MRLLVAIPIFNEASSLKTVLRHVRQYASDILVINDGSTDETPDLLKSERDIIQIHHHTNHGYGQSIIDAFNFATTNEYDWMITMDCDEQHEPARIPIFVRAAAKEGADIISGSRYLRKMSGDSMPPIDRRAINQQITALLNEVLGLNITDAFCGFKAYRVEALKQLNITVPGYGMPLQLWAQAARLGLRVREIPVCLIYNNPQRHFGGLLDDPDVRMLYYYDVLVHELGDQVKRYHRLLGNEHKMRSWLSRDPKSVLTNRHA